MKIRLIIILAILLALTSCRQKNPITETAAPVTASKQTESETVAVYTYYIGNKKTKNYHKPTCSYLPDEKNQIEIPIDQIYTVYGNYTPCGHCSP